MHRDNERYAHFSSFCLTWILSSSRAHTGEFFLPDVNGGRVEIRGRTEKNSVVYGALSWVSAAWRCLSVRDEHTLENILRVTGQVGSHRETTPQYFRLAPSLFLFHHLALASFVFPFFLKDPRSSRPSSKRSSKDKITHQQSRDQRCIDILTRHASLQSFSFYIHSTASRTANKFRNQCIFCFVQTLTHALRSKARITSQNRITNGLMSRKSVFLMIPVIDENEQKVGE